MSLNLQCMPGRVLVSFGKKRFGPTSHWGDKPMYALHHYKLQVKPQCYSIHKIMDSCCDWMLPKIIYCPHKKTGGQGESPPPTSNFLQKDFLCVEECCKVAIFWWQWAVFQSCPQSSILTHFSGRKYGKEMCWWWPCKNFPQSSDQPSWKWCHF